MNWKAITQKYSAGKIFVLWSLLLVSIVISALVALHQTHQFSVNNMNLGTLYQQEIKALEQYHQLLIAREKLASPHQLEQLAADWLDMHLPTSRDIAVLAEARP